MTFYTSFSSVILRWMQEKYFDVSSSFPSLRDPVAGPSNSATSCCLAQTWLGWSSLSWTTCLRSLCSDDLTPVTCAIACSRPKERRDPKRDVKIHLESKTRLKDVGRQSTSLTRRCCPVQCVGRTNGNDPIRDCDIIFPSPGETSLILCYTATKIKLTGYYTRGKTLWRCAKGRRPGASSSKWFVQHVVLCRRTLSDLERRPPR